MNLLQAPRSRRFRPLTAHRRHCRLDVHPHRLEHVSIEILETSAVHEAVILFRSGVGFTTGCDGLFHNPIDVLTALER